jgi:hypothetical protein
MAEAGKQFHHVNGYLHLPALRAALEAEVARTITAHARIRRWCKRPDDHAGPPPNFHGGRDILGGGLPIWEAGHAFLHAGLVDDITITTVPVLIGSGIPFPGALDADIPLIHQSTKVFGAGLVQSAYAVDR